MKPNLLVLLPLPGDRITIRRMQREHLETTGDCSFYIMPPVVILGFTDKKGVDRKKFNMKLDFSKKPTLTELGYIYEADLGKLQEKYSTSGPSGLFFTKDIMPGEKDFSFLESYSLAILESTSEGYLLLQ